MSDEVFFEEVFLIIFSIVKRAFCKCQTCLSIGCAFYDSSDYKKRTAHNDYLFVL